MKSFGHHGDLHLSVHAVGESTYRICDELMILFGLGWMFTGAQLIPTPQDKGRDSVLLPVTEPIYYTYWNNVVRDCKEAFRKYCFKISIIYYIFFLVPS